MPGTKTTTAKLLLFSVFAGGTAVQAQSTWLPLDVGNRWVYQNSWTSSVSFTVEVTGTRESNGYAYSVVKGWPDREETLLRRDTNGTIWELRPDASAESLFLNPNAGIGQEASRAGDSCSGPGILEDTNARVETPVRDFDSALLIRFNPGPCADAGSESDYWAPGVGLVKRTFQTIAGPRDFQLAYARLEPNTVLEPKELHFSISTSKTVHVIPDVLPAVIGAEPKLDVRLTLRNTTEQPALLTYPSSQDFEVVLRNQRGEVIWRWSDGQTFLTVYREEEFTGERTWIVKAPLTDANGKAWEPGIYTVEAELATETRRFKSGVPLRMVKPVG